MGGHGGLNILPQKRWNVYNYDNRERVRKDEEAAAKEEQIKREQSRKRDTEFRLEKLRQARCLPPAASASQSSQSISKSDHINLFEGLKDFPSLEEDVEKEDSQKKKKEMKNKKLKKEEAPRVVLPEDEKYRLGYGLAGKGVKAPWYLSKPSFDGNGEIGGGFGEFDSGKQEGEMKKKSGRKSLEELREQRLKREKQEKEREKALLSGKKRKQSDGSVSRFSGFSRR